MPAGGWPAGSCRPLLFGRAVLERQRQGQSHGVGPTGGIGLADRAEQAGVAFERAPLGRVPARAAPRAVRRAASRASACSYADNGRTNRSRSRRASRRRRPRGTNACSAPASASASARASAGRPAGRMAAAASIAPGGATRPAACARARVGSSRAVIDAAAAWSEWVWRICWAPRRPRIAAVAGSSNTRRMSAAACSTSGSAHSPAGGYGNDASPTRAGSQSTRKELSGLMKSRLPPYPVAIVGLPRYIASAIVSPKPSERCSDT